jgi:carbohydrate diacid regulator
MKEDQKALFTIRNIVMYQIDKDSDLKNIILAMYKNDLNVSKTASSVYMHRNTVINKLDLIKKTSGMDVQKFYDAIALYNLMYLK